MTDPAPTTNARKYQTANPMVQWLIRRFYSRVRTCLTASSNSPHTVLDVGCGEGESLAGIQPMLRETALCCGVDILPESLRLARDRLGFSHRGFIQAQVAALPFPDGQFDLTLCLEVLEHLSDPGGALKQICRVTSGTVLLSVPHEPYFQIGSLLRGKHPGRLGNHPEHVNHWNRASFGEFLDGYLVDPVVVGSFPWVLAYGKPKPSPGSSPDRAGGGGGSRRNTQRR